MDEQITILIVDDDPDVREILGGTLNNQGYRIIFADQGQKAIQLAGEFTPDIILLDVMMPFMDGYEVCRRLRNDPKLSEIPVLMITALNDQGSRIKGIESGADDYISKPFDRAEIRARVRSITRLNRYRRLMLERARFEWVVENATDAYLTIDPLGEITYANGAARTLFSLPSVEHSDKMGVFIDWAQQQFTLMPPSAWQNFPLVSDNQLPMYLIRPQDEQSDALWYQLHLLDLPWNAEGSLLLRIVEVTGSVSFAQEMWSFQAAVSHKFNTPLSSILLASGLVKLIGERKGMPDLVEYGKAIETGGKRLESEVNDIVEYVNAPSLLRSGSRFVIADLSSLVAQTSQDLKLDRVQFTLVDPELMSQRMNITPRAVQIILWEVLENSCKFHPTSSPEVKISLAPLPDRRVLLTILDNGITLSPDQLARAVIPYYQGEKTFTGEVTGMGLGLPTVASLVWASGGTVRMYNRVDQPGIVVEIEFPLTK